MKNFLALTQVNFKRLILRNLRFFAFDILFPAAFYLVFTNVMGKGMPGNFKQTYLVSMLLFATLLSSIITVSNNTLDDKDQHFWRLMDVTPLSRTTYYASFFLTILSLTLVEVLAIELVGCLMAGVHLSIVAWIAIALLSTLGSVTLMLLGAAITYLGDAGMVNLISSMLVFPMAMLSGLWWPLTMFPAWLQSIGKLLPTYQTANIINQLLEQHTWAQASCAGELIWLIIGVACIVLLQRCRQRAA